jgi:hypothetical protein
LVGQAAKFDRITILMHKRHAGGLGGEFIRRSATQAFGFSLPASKFKALDELFDFPDFDVAISLGSVYGVGHLVDAKATLHD